MSVEELLKKIADLLAANDEADWALAFHNFLLDYEREPDATKGRIRSVYGGMGSFNDIILHGPTAMPLRDENDALDRMRSALFTLCQAKH